MNRKEILETADKCVNGHREEDYGSPEDNFSTISKLWSAYKGVEFNSVDVALMLALLKIARARSGKGTDDCFVDLAGYAACAGEIFSKELVYKQSSDKQSFYKDKSFLYGNDPSTDKQDEDESKKLYFKTMQKINTAKAQRDGYIK